ncbi:MULTISPECIES: DUF3881 family protein [unclassified Eisenbergiella]|jgi:hypothetical protein|uniref:DUF3881 family protein n=1 Tax=unclassified Eisenbergiella TaxID=2652273 RepID=UPI000E5004ED|nr:MULTISPECIES: DUF3881 family protein [unclassified Eisenbergiella]RHP78644.1 DUF3881 family protein [Eisenbergiella sp. OF01-20]
MKSEVRFLHKFLKSVGFSEYTSTRKIQELIKDVIMNADSRNYTTLDGKEDTVLVEFCKDFAENMGIAVCGEFDENDTFTFYYFYPYLRGTGVSSMEDVSVERHAAKESYAGVCDDIKVGVTLIFYLQNMIPYIKYRNTDKLPVRGTSLTLSALASQGSIMMPIIKSENQKKKIQQSTMTRNQLIEAARRGDEDAIESLTLEDMDTYTTISRRIQKEDVFSLVDTYFMPYGVECDQYSVLGEISECHVTRNKLTEEELCLMTLNCNELSFDVCINVKDLYGEPKIGRRFKGVVWLQGAVNYPDQE